MTSPPTSPSKSTEKGEKLSTYTKFYLTFHRRLPPLESILPWEEGLEMKRTNLNKEEHRKVPSTRTHVTLYKTSKIGRERVLVLGLEERQVVNWCLAFGFLISRQKMRVLRESRGCRDQNSLFRSRVGTRTCFFPFSGGGIAIFLGRKRRAFLHDVPRIARPTWRGE
jgi:hypothetical protein